MKLRSGFFWPRLRLSIAALLISGLMAFATVPGWGLYAVVYVLFVLAPAFAALGMVSAVLAGICMRRRLGVAALVESAVGAVLVCGFIWPAIAVAPIRIVSGYAQLAFLHKDFAAHLSAASAGEPRLLIRQTNGFLSSASGLLYDESDEIALAPGTQSAAWRSRVGSSPLMFKCWSATHLLGHYYAWTGDHACD